MNHASQAPTASSFSRDVPEAVFARACFHYGIRLDPEFVLDGSRFWQPVGGAYTAALNGLTLVWRPGGPCNITADFQHPIRQRLVSIAADLPTMRVAITDDDFSRLVTTAVYGAQLRGLTRLDADQVELMWERVYRLLPAPDAPADPDAVFCVAQIVQLVAAAANIKLRRQ